MSRWKHFFFFAFVLSLSFAPRFARAQWISIASGIIENPKGTECAMSFENGLLWLGSRTLRVSTDLGKTFTTMVNPALGNISHIEFLDREHGLVADMSSAFTTSDGGLSWTPVYVAPNGGLWTAILLGSVNDILVGDGYPGLVHVSHDGGGTWSDNSFGEFPSCAVFKPASKNVYVFAGDLSNGARIWASHDLGHTWEQRTGNVDFDSWSFQVDGCDEKNIYVSNEDNAVPTDNISQIFVSSDGGNSWAKTLAFAQPFFSGSIAIGPNAIYCPTTAGGIFRSVNHGQFWKNIGGPNHDVDSRMIAAADDNVIFAADDNGGLFKTINSGGDSILPKNGSGNDVLWLPARSLTLEQTHCVSSDTAIQFGFSSCSGSATLVSLTLLDSNGAISQNANLIDTLSLPRPIYPNDLVRLRYGLPSGTTERLNLHLRFKLGSTTHDTTLALSVKNAIDYSARTKSDGSFTPMPNSSLDLPIKIILPNGVATLSGVQNIEYSLTFSSDMLDIDASKLQNLITPPTGWSLASASKGIGKLTVRLHNDAGAALRSPLDLGAVKFTTSLSPKKTSLVLMDVLSIQEANSKKYFCFGTEGDYVASVSVVGSSVEAVAAKLDKISVYPNPTASGAFHVECQLHASAEVAWSLLDVLGSEIMAQSPSRWSAGARVFDVSTSQLPTGSYFLRMRMGESIFTQRVVISR